MTYLVLARKWRPRSFDTLVGQDHVVRALTHALDTQRLHHAWLFTGTRGVGKTTLSRILAKSLNCEQGITSRPCGVCRACTEIDDGRFVDYLELDAASNRGVDEMTQLLEQAVYAPSSGRFKVYMIDEVHMLTGHAFNAMLKTLEEPPPHVKFILATTDPQKIPVTVLSRCLQFNLKQMTVEAMVVHLREVLEQEEVTFEQPALRLLAQAASGSMRDALSLTDQAIAYSAGDLTFEAIQGMLGTLDQRYLVRLLQSLATGSASQVIEVADELAMRGLSYSVALADLAVLLSRIAIQQRIPGALGEDELLANEIVNLAAMLHPDLVQLFYSIAIHSRNELALAPDEYAGFVMACLRMLALAPSAEAMPAGGGAGGASTSHAEPLDALPAGSAPVEVEQVALESAPATQITVQKQRIAQVQASSEPIDAENAHKTSLEQASTEQTDTSPAEPDLEDGALAPHTPASESVAKPLPEADLAVAKANGEAISEAINETTRGADDEPPPWDDIPPDIDATRFEIDEADDAFADVAGDSLDDEGFAPPESAVAQEVVAAVLAAAPRSAPVKKKSQAASLRKMSAQTWPVLAAQLPLSGVASELARQSEWVGVQGNHIQLRVAIHTLAIAAGRSRLRTVLSEHFGVAIGLDVEFGATGDETAHAFAQVEQAARQKEAEQAVRSDVFVQGLIREFGAQVIAGSVRPVLHSPPA